MSDSLPVPVAEEREDDPSVAPTPSREERIAARFASLHADGGLLFDAYHATYAKQAKSGVHPRLRALSENPTATRLRVQVAELDQRQRDGRAFLRMLEMSTVMVLPVDAILEVLNRAQDKLYKPVNAPIWPHYPLWIEWDGVADADVLRLSETTDVGAFWHFLTRDVIEGYSTLTARSQLMTFDFTYTAMVYLPGGAWMHEQVGPCASAATCPIGADAPPGRRYLVQEQRDERRALEHSCACWKRGVVYSRILSCLAEYLGDQKFARVSRARALPKQPKNGKRARDAWQKACDEIRAWNAGHPDYLRQEG